MGSKSKSSSSTTNKAFNFNNLDYGQGGGGGGSLAKNVNLAESSLSVGDIINTDYGAVAGAMNLADSTVKTSADTLLQLGDRAYDDVSQSRELTSELFTLATDSVNSANRESLQFLRQGTERALAFAQQSTRSEAGQVVENLTKYMMIGGAGLAVLILISRRSS